jgi:hypothetical protein
LTPVPLVDATGRQLDNDLVDGDEIEILSWRPRSREGVVYQVVRISDRTEWWIGANYMRREREAIAPVLQSSEQEGQ